MTPGETEDGLHGGKTSQILCYLLGLRSPVNTDTKVI